MRVSNIYCELVDIKLEYISVLMEGHKKRAGMDEAKRFKVLWSVFLESSCSYFPQNITFFMTSILLFSKNK